MVVSDGRTMVTISQPMSVIAAVSDGVAPPPAADELADTGANLAVAITGGIVLMALAIILMPVARRRMS